MKTETLNKSNQEPIILDDTILQARAAFMATTEITDHQAIFVGIGLPCLVAHITQNHTTPNCHLVFESGLTGVICKTQPLSTASANIAKTSKMHGGPIYVEPPW